MNLVDIVYLVILAILVNQVDMVALVNLADQMNLVDLVNRIDVWSPSGHQVVTK